MRRVNQAKLIAAVAAMSGGFFIQTRPASAVNYVWKAFSAGNASGTWATTTNWTPNLPAGGAAANDFADFSQQDVTGLSTVVLGAPETIGAMTFGDTNTTSAGGWVLNSDSTNVSDATNTLNLNAAGGYSLVDVNALGLNQVATINAVLTDGDSGGLELAKGGAGTLVLTGNNSALTGAVAVNDGTLVLDFGHAWSPSTNILGDSSTGAVNGSHLQLQGGTFELLGASGGVNSQTFSAGTGLELGESNIVLAQNGATNLSINLGAVTRNSGSSMDITLPTTGSVGMSLGVSGGAYPSTAFGTQTGLNGLLTDSSGAAFATVNNGADWAAFNGTNLVAASSIAGFYTNSTASTLSGNANVVGNTNLTGNNTIASLRDASTSPGLLQIALGGGTLTTGGILMTSASTNSLTIANGTVNSANTAGGDSFVINNSALLQNININANIVDSAAGGTDLQKDGVGTLALSGNNTYSGWTYINEGALLINGGTTGVLGDVQVAPAFGNTAILSVANGTFNAGRLIIAGNSGNFAGGTGIVNQTGGIINSAYWFTVGGFGNAQFNMSGGVLNETNNNGVSVLEVGVFNSGTGTVNISGSAQINMENNSSIVMGSVNTTGNGTINQNGGTVKFYSDGGTTAGGTGALILGGDVSSGTYTYNLNSGTLIVPAIEHVSTPSTGIMNLNGGTLQATGNTAGYMGGLTQANVGAGGAIVNTNGFNIGISQPLLHASSLGASPDLGLTKNGLGTLVLSGASTYTGATTINAGTLQLPTAAVPVAVGAYSFDNITTPGGSPVTSGVLASGDIVVNSGTGGTAMNGVVNTTDWNGPPGGPASGVNITTGKFGNAVNFDGAGTSIDVPSQIVDQSGGGNWTMSVWVNTTTQGSAFVAKNNGADTFNAGNSTFYLGSNPPSGTPGSLPTAVQNTGGFLQSGTSVTDGSWHMLTFVDAGGNRAVYVDGQLSTDNQTAFSETDTSSVVRIGFNDDVFSQFDGNVNMAGGIDELDFFSSSLSAEQILQLYGSNHITAGNPAGQIVPALTPMNITASGAAFDLNGQTQSIGSLTGVAGSQVLLGGGLLNVGGLSGSTTFAGNVSGNGGVLELSGPGTLNLTGANTNTGGVIVSGGTMVIGANGALPNAAVAISGSGTLKLGTTTGQANMTSLSIAGTGKLDVNNDHIILTYGATDPASTIYGYLKTGYNGGAWTGVGIDSSTAALPANNTHYGVGYVDGADHIPGASVSSGQIEIAYALYGDVNLDGLVNATDFAVFGANFNKSITGWDHGDFTYTGLVNGTDFALLGSNFGKSASGTSLNLPAGDFAALDAFAAANGLALPSVPEPASLGLLTLGAVGVLARRRRSKGGM